MDAAGMKSGVFLQVRLGSMRLKEKALLPLAGLAAIRHVMRALRPIKAEIFAVLTDAESRARLEAYAREEGFAVFEGPTDDVVARYCMAARFYGVERIIRATGDNPLVSAGMADAIIAVHRSRTADLSHYLGLPLGTGVEVIETRALQEAEQRAVDPYEREHITTYLYRRRERFRVVEEPCPEALRMEGVKVSLDTDADYALLRRIYRALYRGEPVEIDHLVRWLKSNVVGHGRRSLEEENSPRSEPGEGNGNGPPDALPISGGQAPG